MKRLSRDHLTKMQPSPDANGALHPPAPALYVNQGESFLIETISADDRLLLSEEDRGKPEGPLSGNPHTGPVYIEGINAGDVICITIESLEVVGHCELEAGEHSLLPDELKTEQTDFVRIENNVAHFPGGLKAAVRPMFGSLGAMPLSLRPEPYTHGGNMDIPDICSGSAFHVRCERDGGYFACGDGHALQGDGEINCGSLEVSLLGQLRIEKSPYQGLKALLIETFRKFITVGIRRDPRQAVTDAAYAMSDLFASRHRMSLHEAYQFVSHVGSVRVGGVYPLWYHENGPVPIPFCLQLDKVHFNQ